jgi:hypothetical protein
MRNPPILAVVCTPAPNQLQLLTCFSGSTIAYPYDDDSNHPIELGASIFIAENRNLVRAASEFNLTMVEYAGTKHDKEIGIWDGEQFIIKVESSLLNASRANGLTVGWLEFREGLVE